MFLITSDGSYLGSSVTPTGDSLFQYLVSCEIICGADLVTMGLPPAKPDMHQFVNTNAPAVLAAWREMDERAVARLNAAGTRVAYAPQHEVSAAYRGLSNDGIHFGEKGLGFSFPVVTDVLTQLWLHRILRPDEAPLGIC